MRFATGVVLIPWAATGLLAASTACSSTIEDGSAVSLTSERAMFVSESADVPTESGETTPQGAIDSTDLTPTVVSECKKPELSEIPELPTFDCAPSDKDYLACKNPEECAGPLSCIRERDCPKTTKCRDDLEQEAQECLREFTDELAEWRNDCETIAKKNYDKQKAYCDCLYDERNFGEAERCVRELREKPYNEICNQQVNSTLVILDPASICRMPTN